jgi:hypothetical protein
MINISEPYWYARNRMLNPRIKSIASLSVVEIVIAKLRKFWLNWFKQGAKHLSVTSINSVTLYGIRKNCLINGSSLLLYRLTNGNKTECSNYHGISLLWTLYKIVSSIILSRSSSSEEITGNHQCGFQHNISSTHHIFCIHQILEKIGVQWDSTSAIHRLQGSLWFSEDGVFYKIIIEFGVPMKLVRLIEMCLMECSVKSRWGSICHIILIWFHAR